MIFGGFWESVDSFGEACGLIQIDRFSMFLVDFGRVLGSHVGAILEAKTDENWREAILLPFCRASKMKAVSETILAQFSWRLEKQK